MVSIGSPSLGPAMTTRHPSRALLAMSVSASLFGLVFVFHQLGAVSAAVGGGWIRKMQFGDDQYAFLIGGCMGLMAACLAFGHSDW